MAIILYRSWDPQPVTLGQLPYEIGFRVREEEFGVDWVRQDIVNEERKQKEKGYGWIPNKFPKPEYISQPPCLEKRGSSYVFDLDS